jgi:hypothetical protein
MSIDGLFARKDGARAASDGMINRGLNFDRNAEKNLPGAFTAD